MIKEQAYHRDSSARAIGYQRLIDSHGPWLRIATRSGNIDVARNKLVDWIEVDEQIPPSLMTEEDMAPLRKTLRDWQAFAERYPASRALLDPPVGALAGHIARFDSGEVRYEGAWLTRERHAAIEQERQAGLVLARQKEIERLAFESAQRDKGLVEFKGRWIPAAEVPAADPSARTDLSDAILPLRAADLDSARPTLQNLTRLAAGQTGAPKVRTERLHAAIRNLFLAESRLSRSGVEAVALRAQAAAHDRRAMEWLKPNAFGTQRRDEARASHAQAMQLRQQAEGELDARRAELIQCLEQADLLAQDFHDSGEWRVALILGETVRQVASRSIGSGKFHPTFPDAALEEIRKQLTWNRAAPES